MGWTEESGGKEQWGMERDGNVEGEEEMRERKDRRERKESKRGERGVLGGGMERGMVTGMKIKGKGMERKTESERTRKKRREKGKEHNRS